MGEEVDLREIREELAERRLHTDAVPSPAALRPPIRPTLLGTLSAIPDFVGAGVFLITWINPTLLRPDMLNVLLLVMLFEFISIHSSAFMTGVMMAKWPTGKKIAHLIGFGVFYSLIAGGFSRAFHAWWPFISLWAQVGNRSLGLLLRGAPDKAERQAVRKAQAVGMLAYIGFVFLTILLPVPALGVYPGDGAGMTGTGGVWVEQPQKLLAFGFLYFLGVGLSEMVEHRWMGDVGPGTMTINGRDVPMEE
jgi:hypothetical protein